MRRFLTLLLAALMTATAMAAVPAPASASAAPRPTVSSFSATAGPVGRTARITLTGSRLKKVTKARFGKVRARISSKRSTSLVLTVPRSRKARTVKVQLYSGRKWRTVGTYTFVARPSIARLSRSTGQLLGGQGVVVSGRALDRVQRVVVSGTSARITRRTASSLTFVTPPSVPGATTVQVVSPGGAAAAPFSYVAPTPTARASIRTVGATFRPVVGEIQWVVASDDQGYVVSLAPGATLPAVGDPFYLAAGAPAYPTGLAGRVESLAAQADDSTRVVVRSVPLDKVFSALDVDVTKKISPAVLDAAASSSAGRARASAPSGSLGQAFRSAFSCDRDAGFSGSLEIKVSDLVPHFETKGFGNPFQKNEVIGYISGRTEVSGALKAEGALECDLDPAWQNSHRKVVSLGYGVTYSIAPEVHVSISASGSVSITRSQTFLYGTHWKEGEGPRRIQDAGTPQVTVEGKLAGSVSLEGGVSNRLGLLDRIGVEVEGLLYVDGEASFTAGSTGKFCLQATFGLKAPVKLFLDVWIDEATTTLFTIVVQFGSLNACGRVWGAPDTDAPQVMTTRLADATVGSPYYDTLLTADDRPGTWRTGSPLPPGLSLGSDGTVTGTPTGGIGTRTLVVTFEDEDGNLATTPVTLRVNPPTGLGGGDIQATLTWSHAADMDLHALEPDGTEIYYDNPASGSGGELDHDSNVGCGDDSLVAENIRWPAGAAATGVYYFRVQTYRQCSVADPTWHLVVRVDGQVVVDRSGSGTSDWIEVDRGTAGRDGARGPAGLPEPSQPAKG